MTRHQDGYCYERSIRRRYRPTSAKSNIHELEISVRGVLGPAGSAPPRPGTDDDYDPSYQISMAKIKL